LREKEFKVKEEDKPNVNDRGDSRSSYKKYGAERVSGSEKFCNYSFRLKKK